MKVRSHHLFVSILASLAIVGIATCIEKVQRSAVEVNALSNKADITQEIKTNNDDLANDSKTFDRVNSSSDLVFGKRYLICSRYASSTMSSSYSQNNKRRGSYTGVVFADSIDIDSSMGVFTLCPGENGSYAFYDENAKKLLCSTSSKTDSIATNGGFNTKSAFSTVNISNGDATIVFGGGYTHKNLYYKIFGNYFSCGENSSTISVFASENEAVIYGETWAQDFLNLMDSACDPTGVKPLSESVWNEAVNSFNESNYELPEMLTVAYGTSGENSLLKLALQKYDYIVAKYSNLNNFLSRKIVSAQKVSGSIFGGNNSEVSLATLTIVSAISISLIGAFVITHKKAKNN